jgi:hypothetical protein
MKPIKSAKTKRKKMADTTLEELLTAKSSESKDAVEEKPKEAKVEEPEFPNAEAKRFSRRSDNCSEFRQLWNVIDIPTATASRKDSIRKAKCVLMNYYDIYNKNDRLLFYEGDIIKSPNAGNALRNMRICYVIEEASLFTVDEIVEHRKTIDMTTMIGILNPDLIAAEPKRRLWSVVKTLNTTLVELAMVAPMNPTLRAHLANIFHETPPADCDTYQKLVDWMEYEHKIPVWENDRKRMTYGWSNDERHRMPVAAPQERERTAMVIDAVREFQETGRITYESKCRIKANIKVPERIMTDLVQQGLTVDQIFEEVSTRWSGITTNPTAEMELEPMERGETKYDDQDREVLESSPGSCVFDRKVFNKKIKEWLVRKFGKSEAEGVMEREA